jgi:3-oxoadipate enol-lactonase
MDSGRTDRITLNFSTSGDNGAPALVLAHPLGADLGVWDALVPALSDKFHVIRFDARGHGGSPRPPGPYSLDDLGGDVLALMDDLGLAQARFIGLSMGGAIGQWLMIHAPARLEKIVLANTAAHFPDAAGWNGRIHSARENGMSLLAPAVAQRWLTPEFSAARPDIAAKIVKMLGACDPKAYAATCAALRDTDLRDAIAAAPRCPALVIVGDADPSTPPALGAALAKSLTDARLVRLPAAHLSCVEAEQPFLQAVLEFLA